MVWDLLCWTGSSASWKAFYARRYFCDWQYLHRLRDDWYAKVHWWIVLYRKRLTVHGSGSVFAVPVLRKMLWSHQSAVPWTRWIGTFKQASQCFTRTLSLATKKLRSSGYYLASVRLAAQRAWYWTTQSKLGLTKIRCEITEFWDHSSSKIADNKSVLWDFADKFPGIHSAAWYAADPKAYLVVDSSFEYYSAAEPPIFVYLDCAGSRP